MNKEYKNIMKRLKACADENGMVSLDAVAEAVNQELVPALDPDLHSDTEPLGREIQPLKMTEPKELYKLQNIPNNTESSDIPSLERIKRPCQQSNLL